MNTRQRPSQSPSQPQPLPQAAPTAAPASSGRPWLASRLLQRRVVNASTVESVGRVSDVEFNPQSCQVSALIVRAAAGDGGGSGGEGPLDLARRVVGQRRTVGILGIDHLIALNGDVVMADSDPFALPPTARPAPKPALQRETCLLSEVCELTIVTLHGMCLGVLADLLLDERGTHVTGYVVTPTKFGEAVLMPLEEKVQAEPPAIEGPGVIVAEASKAASPDQKAPDPHARVIPASPRVRIGASLILVVEEVEPLRQDPVIVSSDQTGEQPGHSNGVYLH